VDCGSSSVKKATLDRQIAEHDDVIDAVQGADELARPQLPDGTVFAFNTATIDRRHRDDDRSASAAASLKVANVADVQQIEATVGERDRTSARALA